MAGDFGNIKADSGSYRLNGDDAPIKPDPDSIGASPGVQSDDDFYEDAGDLDFAESSQGIYLTRLPKFLWKSWSTLEDDQEIRLGTVRVEGMPGDIKRMSLLLSSDVAANENVPKEYNMQITNREPANTFMFTERDLPGYNSKTRGSGRQAQGTGSLPFSQVPPRREFQDRVRQTSSKIDKTKKWQQYFRKAIPKKTAITGQVKIEINCLPVENDEYRRIMDERTRQAMKPKRETQLLTGLVSSHGGNLLAPGTLGAPGNFNTFIKTTGVQRGKPQELKAARIPQNELLDLIYDCFKKYNYWPLKSLKAELNQPEAYLKQTLELVAHLVRQGPHAMTWQLKPESKISAYADAQSYEQVKDEIAPDNSYGIDGPSDTGEGLGSDDDDENMKLEDVIPL